MKKSKSGLTCATTQNGLASYREDGTIIIILREHARNLKWYSSVETDEKSSFPAGTVFIVPAFTTLSINWSDPVEIIIMQPDQQLFQDSFFQNSLFKENNSPKNVTSFSCKDCMPLSHLIWDEICRRGGQDEAYLNALGLVLMRTIARVLLNERASTDSKIGLSKVACQQIEAYLNQNFHKPLSVPDMAALLGISAGHFSTCFRQSFGQTPHQYLMELRLDEAERCLRKTSMPINEIARHLNFSSQSDLTTALRKHRQLTPGELRK